MSSSTVVTIEKPNGASLRAIPSKCLITGWRNGEGWEVFYEAPETKNMSRLGLPTILPIFSKLDNDLFSETGTTIPKHGFEKFNLLWEHVTPALQPDAVSMKLVWNDTTYPIYPFKFEFIVTVRLFDDGSITHTLTMKNLETDKMLPVQPGIHPYFSIPLDLKKKLTVEGIDGFDPAKWEWTTVQNTPDNTYSFTKDGVKVTVPGVGKFEMIEQPSGGVNYYKQIQVWSEPSSCPDHDFICFEPVNWGPNGLNHPEKRINVPASSEISITMKFKATKA